MAAGISRRKLAVHAAALVAEGQTTQAVNELAAYLVANKREREADLVVRDIEQVLAERGVVIAKVTSARPLTAELMQAVTRMIGANQAQVTQVVDPSVIGGVLIELPGKQYDGTLRHKLNAIKKLTVN